MESFSLVPPSAWEEVRLCLVSQWFPYLLPKGKTTLRILDPVSGFRGVTSAACFDRRFHGGEWWLLATRSCGRQLEDGTSDDVLLHFEKSLFGGQLPFTARFNEGNFEDFTWLL